MTRRSNPRVLRALADRVGIIPEYVDQTGNERRRTTDQTRVALLGALGYDASTDEAAKRTLAELRAAEGEQLIPPVCVTTDGAAPIVCEPPAGWPSRVEWELEVVDEDGGVARYEGRAAARSARRIKIAAGRPAHEIGYYTLRLTLRARQRVAHASQRLIVVPARCAAPQTVLHGERAVGLIANLYALRSAQNWGVGDMGDLRRLLDWSARIGAAFIGVNPLHALRNRGTAISPYGPVSRLFRNVLYIDVESIPELVESTEARSLIEQARPSIARLRAASHLDYDAVMRVKRPVLEALHRTFVERHRDRATPRGRAYAEYTADQGDALDDFATWSALDEQENGGPWQEWPAELRAAHSPAVRSFRASASERVDLHRWLQFELDRQLGEAQAHARELALPVGLYQDLAIASAADGSDTWMNPDLFVTGAAIGAPPDPLATTGQNWGLPPINPQRLAAEGYAYWVRLVRDGLRHGGALRIDHILGLFRQYWIPAGMPGSQGAYVRFPADDLLGILALESVRAGGLIVGEDLGTVPPEVPPALERWGILSSKVLYFERDAKGRFKPPNAYPQLALTTANTHDMPSLAAFWREHDIDLRGEVGAISTTRELERARRERATTREALATALIDQGLWPIGNEPSTDLALRESVHAFLRRTPSWMVGLSLDDLAGEVEPVNIPGVPSDRWPSWTRRMTMTVDELSRSAEVRRALGAEREGTPGG